MASKIPKAGSKFGQIQNKNYQILKEFGKSDEISPSLVTLAPYCRDYLQCKLCCTRLKHSYLPENVEQAVKMPKKLHCLNSWF